MSERALFTQPAKDNVAMHRQLYGAAQSIVPAMRCSSCQRGGVNTKGAASQKRFAGLILHFFNLHHRGASLHQSGMDSGVTELLALQQSQFGRSSQWTLYYLLLMLTRRPLSNILSGPWAQAPLRKARGRPRRG